MFIGVYYYSAGRSNWQMPGGGGWGMKIYEYQISNTHISEIKKSNLQTFYTFQLWLSLDI